METGPDTATGLYDVKRLARRLGVKTSTIRSMKARGTIPPPTSNDINGGAVWSADTINQFLSVDKTKINAPLTKSSNRKLPRIIDLFSGCGGMSLGFSNAGFEVIAGFDNWEDAVITYNNNFGHSAYNLDLDDLEGAIKRLSPFFVDECPAIIGGPPCQDFSSAGKRKEGDRADLTEKFASIVAHFKPPFFVMENVDRAEKSNAFMQAKKIFSDAGYFVEQIVLNASYCGVPQRRKRLFTFGGFSAEKTKELLLALKNNQSSTETTIRDYFGETLGTQYYYRHPRSYARRAIFSIDEPSPTIRGVNRPIPEGYPGHRGDAGPIEEARPLTTHERAEIQTFPKNFVFEGSKTTVEQMIGNAVPVNMANYVAKAIIRSRLWISD
ncbi:MAG: DNA (cytosine-5-)-methyltransferase [Saccharofermentanales bacterium]|jgi:DNA (cytosine-5)-methyltransferase 1